MRRTFNKLLLLFGLVQLFTIHDAKAQEHVLRMTKSVSRDSLIFMLYGDLDHIESGQLERFIHKQFSEELEDVLGCAEEFCFYAHRRELYDCYTLRFNQSTKASGLNTDHLFQALQLNKTSEESSFIKLNGDKYKKGFLRMDGNQYILKLYVQTRPVNPKIREEYEDLVKQLRNGAYYSKQDIYDQIDSLTGLDSIQSLLYFDKLIDHEMKAVSQKKVKNPVEVKKVFGNNLNNTTAIAFFDAKKISELPFLLFQSTSYDNMKMIDFINSMGGIYNYYDKIWLGFKQEENKMIVTSIANTKGKMDLYKKLDDDIVCRLPAERAKLFMVYHMNLAELKSYVVKYFAATEFKDYQRAIVKLVALAIDDDVLNIFGNVSLSVLKGDLNGRELPEFKIALKMPNENKGQLLLSILCDDLNVLKKEGENYYTVIKEYNKSENPIHLFIDDDVWVLGNGDIQSLKYKLTKSQINSVYPELSNNTLSQYLDLDFQALSKYDKEFQKLNVKTTPINNTSVKTVIEVLTQPE